MKRKVNINRPQVSADEINQRKDFDSVLKTHLKASKPFFKKPWFLSSVVVATVAIVGAVFLLKDTASNQIIDKENQLVDNNANNSGNKALEEFYKQEENKPCIAPPIEGLNVPFTVFKVNAAKGAELKFKTGSSIKIPKNAFVDLDGNIVKGDLEIRYREFHDVAEIFVAGIPMTYDSAGTRYHFESAGMLQIEGYQNGKKVNIAPDKKINIEMASKDTDPKYNLYELDTIKNNWTCLGKDKIIKKEESTKTTTTTTNNNNNNNNKDIIVWEQPKPNSEIFAIEKQKTEIKVERDQKIAALPNPVMEAKKPVKANTEKYIFNIDVNPKEFPELSVYKGMLFEVTDETKGFTKSMYNGTWDDAKIKEGTKKGENYILTLERQGKSLDVIVKPVFEGKDYEAAMKVYQEKFEKYSTALVKRKEDEKKIEEDYKAKMAAIAKREEEMEKKIKEAEANLFNQMDTQQKVYRAFAVSGFGVYNCDNPIAYPKETVCTANLVTDKNVKLQIYEVYLVDKSKNALFTYAKNPIAQFSYNPGAQNILWTVENGVLYYALPEDFNSFKSSGKMTSIYMKKPDKKFNSIEEFKTFFNI
jgi:hypothetical protein